MSFIEKRNEIRPETGEAPFSLDEVFFSRTDARGVIESGNYVFRRTADYEWDDLIGAPHKIIRHPDMPRAVFYILWDHIKAGKPIGAYVKNRARDGLFYWVFAVIAPAGEGYISARIKPTSDLFTTIQGEYEKIRALELEQDISPEDSAARLLERLNALGFNDYASFAAHALSEELLARDRGRKIPEDKRFHGFRDALASSVRLKTETAALVGEFHAMRTVPHNMQVIASRLEPTGGPVSTLSKNYSAISREMSEWFATNVVGTGSNFSSIQHTVTDAMLLAAIARILHECDTQFESERRALGELDLGAERGTLSQQVSDYTSKSNLSLAKARREANRVRLACETMQRHVLALSSTRVLCKIESGRTPGAGDALADIITQLGTFQERISAKLDAIAAESRKILESTR